MCIKQPELVTAPEPSCATSGTSSVSATLRYPSVSIHQAHVAPEEITLTERNIYWRLSGWEIQAGAQADGCALERQRKHG